MTPTTETTLRFTGDYSVMGVWAAAFGLAALMWFLYRREAVPGGGLAARLPAAARSLAVFILVLALSGPVLRRETTQRQLGRVVLAVDTSASMKLEDDLAPAAAGAEAAVPATAGGGRGSQPRLQRAEQLLLGGVTPLIKKLTETQDVELVLLRGQQTQRLWWHRQGGKDVAGPQPTTFQVQADGAITNLDQPVRDALGPLSPGSALVLLSDGQHNGAGSPEELAATLKDANVPVFTIGFGTEVPPPDLSVLNVVTAESVFSEEVLQGRVLVNDTLPTGTPAALRIASQGRVLWEQNFTGEGRGERRFEFSFPVKDLPPPDAAERDKTLRLLQVQVAALGERANLEKTRANNAREVAVHLLNKKRKALILDGRPRWETRYVHNHFDRDERWEATLLIDDHAANPAEGALQKKFPRTREELLGYDLVILGDVGPSRLDVAQAAWLVDFVEKRGGGLILVDGSYGHLKEWNREGAAQLLPVRWAPGGGKSPRGALWHLTPEGGRSDALRLSDSPSSNTTLWPTLPQMTWTAQVQAQPAATVLAELRAPDGPFTTPAAVFRPVGAGAVLYLATDDLWRWRFQVGDLHHQRLWMQLAAWISAPPFQAENARLSIGTDRLRYTPGEQGELRVRLRGTDGGLVSNAEPRAFLLLDGREVASLPLEPDPVHLGVYRALTPPLKSGAYEIAVAESASSPRSDLRLSLRVADPGNPEWATLTMNRPLLETLAGATGGRFLREEQAATELPGLLQAVDRKQTTVQETLLWSSWWWFGAVVALLTAEWLLRKRLRLV